MSAGPGALSRWFPLLAVLVPCLILAAIDRVAVEPRRAAEQSARGRADALRGDLARLQALTRRAPAPAAAPSMAPPAFSAEMAPPAPIVKVAPPPLVAAVSVPESTRPPVLAGPLVPLAKDVEVVPRVVKAVATVKPAQPDPIVHTILYSSQNRSALVDRRIVRRGDRVAFGVVTEIDSDSVIFLTDNGLVRRLSLEQPVTSVVRK